LLVGHEKQYLFTEGHDVQEVELDIAVYLPDGQRLHKDPDEYFPAGHTTQADADVDPVKGLAVPAGQA